MGHLGRMPERLEQDQKLLNHNRKLPVTIMSQKPTVAL